MALAGMGVGGAGGSGEQVVGLGGEVGLSFIFVCPRGLTPGPALATISPRGHKF